MRKYQINLLDLSPVRELFDGDNGIDAGCGGKFNQINQRGGNLG